MIAILVDAISETLETEGPGVASRDLAEVHAPSGVGNSKGKADGMFILDSLDGPAKSEIPEIARRDTFAWSRTDGVDVISNPALVG
jgi:hypothetical protein